MSTLDHPAPLRIHSPVRGTGEMADLVRAMDWSTTPLGAIETWSEALLTAVNIILSASLPMQLLLGPDMVVLYNDHLLPFMAGKHPQSLGRPGREVWNEVWPVVGAQLESVLHEGVSVQFKDVLLRLLRNDVLEDMYWNYSYSPIYGADGQVLGVLNVSQNTTDAVVAQHQLRAAEARATRILQSIGDAVMVTDAETRVTGMNPVAEALTGWTETEAKGRLLEEIFRIVDETGRQPVDSPADKVRRTGAIAGLANHTILIARDGHETPIDDSAAPVRNEIGDLTGIVLVFRDIRERRRAERQRDRALARLTQIQEVTTDNILGIDRDWRISYMNPRARQTLAAAGAEVGQKFWEAFPAAFYTGSPYVEHYTRAMEDGTPADFEASYGEPLNLQVEVHVRPTSEGIALFTLDITEKHHREAKLRQLLAERQRFYTLTESSQDFIAMCDLEGKPIYGNPAARALVGLPAEADFFRVNLADFFFPEDRAQILDEFLPRVLREHHAEMEIRFRHQQTGEPILMSYQVFLLEDATGRPFGYGTVSRDLTMTRQTTMALMQNEKLAAVGRLAASIAHEINNPLESVTNLLYLGRHSDSLADIQEYLELAERELRRVSVISNQTLRFYRQSTNPTAVSCSDLFTEVLSIHQGRIVNSRITVEKRKRARRAAECFEGEIRQVVNNLIGNAIDAMHPTGGRLIVRSREATNWKSMQKGLVLTVADTGGGMPPQVQRRIFEAFYTTKGIGGTGLGLWVSKEIVDRHRGTLHVRSSQKEGASGTVFTLFIPFEAAVRRV